MNILVPLNNFDHFSILYEAGAREFYSGFYDDKWNDKYGKYKDLNRLSGFGRAANQYSLEELADWLKKTKAQPISSEVFFILHLMQHLILHLS